MRQDDADRPRTSLGDDPTEPTRDGFANLRDGSADSRDDNADLRDQIADERDRIADRRDRAAEDFEVLIRAGMNTDALEWAAEARRDARADRAGASGDRRAAATGRRAAERDRDASVADRAASADERQSASVDGLTGVYLRAAGFAELNRELARAQHAAKPLVVAFVDVDGLKAINDSRGHASGDAVLVTVADTLRSQLRPHDLIFRYGGDEIVCALPGVNLADAQQRFANINAALAATPTRGSVTVGLARFQRNDTAQSIVARADTALYLARRNSGED